MFQTNQKVVLPKINLQNESSRQKLATGHRQSILSIITKESPHKQLSVTSLKKVDKEKQKQEFIKKQKELNLRASSSAHRLTTQVQELELVRLRGVLPKKIKEFNMKKKLKQIAEYDSSDLSFMVKY